GEERHVADDNVLPGDELARNATSTNLYIAEWRVERTDQAATGGSLEIAVRFPVNLARGGSGHLIRAVDVLSYLSEQGTSRQKDIDRAVRRIKVNCCLND